MFNEQFFCSPCKVRCSGDFNPVFVIVPLLAGLFCNHVGIVGPFVKPFVVPLHLGLEPSHIQPQKRVVSPRFGNR